MQGQAEQTGLTVHEEVGHICVDLLNRAVGEANLQAARSFGEEDCAVGQRRQIPGQAQPVGEHSHV